MISRKNQQLDDGKLGKTKPAQNKGYYRRKRKKNPPPKTRRKEGSSWKPPTSDKTNEKKKKRRKLRYFPPQLWGGKCTRGKNTGRGGDPENRLRPKVQLAKKKLKKRGGRKSKKIRRIKGEAGGKGGG